MQCLCKQRNVKTGSWFLLFCRRVAHTCTSVFVKTARRVKQPSLCVTGLLTTIERSPYVLFSQDDGLGFTLGAVVGKSREDLEIASSTWSHELEERLMQEIKVKHGGNQSCACCRNSFSVAVTLMDVTDGWRERLAGAGPAREDHIWKAPPANVSLFPSLSNCLSFFFFTRCT